MKTDRWYLGCFLGSPLKMDRLYLGFLGPRYKGIVYIWGRFRGRSINGSFMFGFVFDTQMQFFGGAPQAHKTIGAPATQSNLKCPKNLYLGSFFDTQIQVFGGARLEIFSFSLIHTNLFDLRF